MAQEGRLEELQWRLEEEPALVESVDAASDRSLLIVACRSGHAALVPLLLSMGADINQRVRARLSKAFRYAASCLMGRMARATPLWSRPS